VKGGVIDMSRQALIKIWNETYGNKEDVIDYSGRLMKRSAIGNPRSRYEPTIDHIRPLSLGGKDVLENMVICNRLTNQEKADRFSTWIANGKTYQGVRVKGNRSAYRIQ
jgi:CRISPR/Cas system Type II protein with McrA/HNH and RuvC-like nuclease domain